MTIGERILEIIHQNGMTQKEFSDKTGIPQSTLSSWKGKKQNPSMDKLKVICDVLKVDPYYIISGAESNEMVKDDYIAVYRGEEEYNLMIEYQKLNKDNRRRLMGYLRALQDMNN